MSSVTDLKNNLISSIGYIRYDEIYKNERIIDKDLLIKLLEENLDFYIVFLKLNIFLWRYDTKNLNKDLKDYKHYKGKILRIDDIDTVYRYYYRNYNRVRNAMKKVICYNLRPKSELNLLKQILARPIEEEIYPINEFEEQIKNEDAGSSNEIVSVDDFINTLNGNSFIVIASRPNMGKSTLGYNIVNKVSKRTNGTILYFNYETSKDLLKSKIISDNIEIVDDATTTIDQIKSKCESTNCLSLVVIDYLQLIPNSCNDTSKNEIDYISRTLKTLTLELNIPIIVLSQLGRQVENRENKRPVLRDLDIMGSLAQDSDKVIFLYRESYYNKNYKTNDLELIVAKNRGGSIGTIKVLIDDKEKYDK